MHALICYANADISVVGVDIKADMWLDNFVASHDFSKRVFVTFDAFHAATISNPFFNG